MADSFFQGPTLDDVMHDAISAIKTRGDRIYPSKGDATELGGVLLEIENPRARLSRTETRGKPFSCLGELCWYLAQTNKLDLISYYIPEYEAFAENGSVYGGYGPRLFCWKDLDQVANVIGLLSRKPYSRQAVIQLFDAMDIAAPHKDVPCTCALQFMIRHDRLHMITYMRSNDAFVGLPHDVFCFTMLQEIIARTLSVELGTYKHAVGSLHLYDRNKGAAERFLNEGYQSTEMPMPQMPEGTPWGAINSLRKAEVGIRTGDVPRSNEIEHLDSYWGDLIRLLLVFRYWKDGNFDEIRRIRAIMVSAVYDTFIEKKLDTALSFGK